MNRLSTGGMVCLLAITVFGCNSGSRDGQKPVYSGSTAAGVGSGGTAGTPGSSGVLTAVAVHSDLISDLAPANQVIVFVNDATLTNPILTVDTGTGFVDSGRPAQTAQGMLFFTVPQQQGAKYKVIGRNGSSTRVESNEVTGSTYQAGAITLNEPVGDYTGISNLIPAPSRTTWVGTQNVRHMVILRNPLQQFEWIATVSFNSYMWGDSFADTFKVGATPLTSGRYKLTVLELDASGWATKSSDKNNGNGQINSYSFEVQ